MPAQYIVLQSHTLNNTILHHSFGLYEEEEEAYAAALVRQMQSIEESSKQWPKSVIDDHWQTIHTLCKHMKEALTSFKERWTHLQSLALFAVHCPVSYHVVALQAAEEQPGLNESLFRTKTRNFMDAFQPSKTDDEVDLANSEEEEDDDEDEFSEDDDEEEDIENTEGEESEEEVEEEDDEVGDDEDEDDEEEDDENNPPLEDSENPVEEDDFGLPLEEDSENPLLEEDEFGQQVEEHTIPETEEEDQIHDEQSDEEGSGNEENNSRGLKRSSRSLRIKAGQTGLPWLTKDAETTSPHPETETPPPKFAAQPTLVSVLRLPTQKRAGQKHVYRMGDGISPIKMSLFNRIKKVEIKNGKSYRKIDSNFALPSAVQDQFKSSNGVQDAWAAFRQFARENSLVHQDFVGFIESEMMPTLNQMLKDIHHFTQSLIHNRNLQTNTLYNYRKRSDKIITQFNKEIYKAANDYEESIKTGKGPYFIPKKDPLLTKYVVANTIEDLYKHENQLHKNFLIAQDDYRKFEQEKVIDAYTQLFQSFEAYRLEHGLERSEGVSKIVQIFTAIETDSEWQEFLHHHQNELVKTSASFKEEHARDFPNMSHPLVQPLLIGDMKRKVGSSKWHNQYYVLSPAGVLYCFKSEKDFHHRPHQPIFRSFVPEAFSIQTNSTTQLLDFKGKVLGFFGGKKHLELTTTNPQDIEQWANIMGAMTSKQFSPVVASEDANVPPPANAQEVQPPVEQPPVEHAPVEQPPAIQQAPGTQQETKSSPTDGGRLVEDLPENQSKPPTPKSEEQILAEKKNNAHQLPPIKREESDVFYDTVAQNA
ncbi:hypothetical protein BY458DRAFT_531166 [Sporodiniella umbellata]|nr:hypothetical protein BY458DRAFT_531166 [Sporodiniella umbellata]